MIAILGSVGYTIYTTDSNENVSIESGSTFMNRTGAATTAYELGQRLSHRYVWYFYSWGPSTAWVQIIKYNTQTHQYGNAFLPTYGEDSENNFNINTGDTIFIGTSGAGSLYMNGWSIWS